jgi:hypothetical protein
VSFAMMADDHRERLIISKDYVRMDASSGGPPAGQMQGTGNRRDTSPLAGEVALTRERGKRERERERERETGSAVDLCDLRVLCVKFLVLYARRAFTSSLHHFLTLSLRLEPAFFPSFTRRLDAIRRAEFVDRLR